MVYRFYRQCYTTLFLYSVKFVVRYALNMLRYVCNALWYTMIIVCDANATNIRCMCWCHDMLIWCYATSPYVKLMQVLCHASAMLWHARLCYAMPRWCHDALTAYHAIFPHVAPVLNKLICEEERNWVMWSQGKSIMLGHVKTQSSRWWKYN